MQNIKKYKNKCTGCFACMTACPFGAIKSGIDQKGFFKPIVNLDICQECGICLKACPIEAEVMLKSAIQRYAAKRKIKRMKSQSGGVFLAIAEQIIKNNGVVYAVALTTNYRAEYGRFTKKKELYRAAGSKYVQAYSGDIFSAITKDLSTKKKVLVGGTPCLLAGLQKYLELYSVQSDSLFTCDLICHGVPSPLIYEKYVKSVEYLHGARVKRINHRDKYFGWQNHVFTYRLSNGRRFVSGSYVNYFYSNLALNEACYHCNYARKERIGDLSIGDCWGIDEIYKRFNDDQGVSIMHVNTKKGMYMVKSIRKEFILANINETECIQNNLRKPTEKPMLYEEFWKDFYKKGMNAISDYCEYDLKDKPVSLFFYIYKEIKRYLQNVKRFITSDYI